MEKWFVLAPEMLLDLHPGLSYLREVSIVRLDTLKANTDVEVLLIETANSGLLEGRGFSKY